MASENSRVHLESLLMRNKPTDEVIQRVSVSFYKDNFTCLFSHDSCCTNRDASITFSENLNGNSTQSEAVMGFQHTVCNFVCTWGKLFNHLMACCNRNELWETTLGCHPSFIIKDFNRWECSALTGSFGESLSCIQGLLKNKSENHWQVGLQHLSTLWINSRRKILLRKWLFQWKRATN